MQVRNAFKIQFILNWGPVSIGGKALALCRFDSDSNSGTPYGCQSLARSDPWVQIDTAPTHSKIKQINWKDRYRRWGIWLTMNSFHCDLGSIPGGMSDDRVHSWAQSQESPPEQCWLWSTSTPPSPQEKAGQLGWVFAVSPHSCAVELSFLTLSSWNKHHKSRGIGSVPWWNKFHHALYHYKVITNNVVSFVTYLSLEAALASCLKGSSSCLQT